MSEKINWPDFSWRCPECRSSQILVSPQQLICGSCQNVYPLGYSGADCWVEFFKDVGDSNHAANLKKYNGDRTDALKKTGINHSKKMKMLLGLNLMFSHIDNGQVVLDIGGGEGSLLHFLNQSLSVDVVGLDLSKQNILARTEHTSLKKNVVADMLKLPFADQIFDTCLFMASLHHVPDTALALAEAFRVLKPGGKMIFFEPFSMKRLFSRSPMKMTPDGVEYSFSAKYVLRLLKQTGVAKIMFSSLGITAPLISKFRWSYRTALFFFNLGLWQGRLPILKYFCFEGLIVAQKPS